MIEEVMPKGYMMDSQGRLIPKDKVKAIDKERDKLTKKLLKEAEKVSEIMREFKISSMQAVKEFMDVSASEYGVKLGGRKGNVQLLSYDGSVKIILSVHDYITFDERLQAAKELIDSCIRRWSKGARNEIKVLVEDAFKVDKQGKVDTQRILSLRKLDINDEEWRQAMNAISDSLTVLYSKEYLRIYKRQDDVYLPVQLDLSSIACE